MELKPCINDIISVIAIWPVIILCELLFLIVSHFPALFSAGLFFLNIILCFFSLRDLIYFARRIRFDAEGCTISLWKFQKQYKWDCLNIQLWDDRKPMFSDSDITGPGLLVYPKAHRYAAKCAAMTYCRKKIPFSGIYIRFASGIDKSPGQTGKTVYYGYVMERRILMDFFADTHIQVAYS